MSLRYPAGVWRTSDIGVAGYVMMRGLKLNGISRDSKSRCSILFEDPSGLGPGLEVDYLNSDCRKFDSHIRSIKKLINDRKRG